MSLVLDASLTMAWYFEGENTPATEELFTYVGVNGAFVPPLWRLEVANSFQSGIRRKRMTAQFRDDSLMDLAQLPIKIDQEPNDYLCTTTLRLADRYGLTVYDACYLELAQRVNLPLASLDEDLRAAAETLGLPVLGI